MVSNQLRSARGDTNDDNLPKGTPRFFHRISVCNSHRLSRVLLEADILDGKQQYEFSEWERGNYMVFDKDHGEQFEITVKGADLLIHAKESTTSSSLRDFCSLIFEEFDSTYSLEKTSRKLKA